MTPSPQIIQLRTSHDTSAPDILDCKFRRCGNDLHSTVRTGVSHHLALSRIARFGPDGQAPPCKLMAADDVTNSAIHPEYY